VLASSVTETDLGAALRAARAQGRKTLDEPSGKAILASFDIRVPAFRVVRSNGDLDAIKGELRPPYVLKVVSAEVVHKSDFGAVKVGLKDEFELNSALDAMRATLEGRGIRADCWMVEEMVPAGLECVIGGVVDPEFGPMVMVGLGGILVELMGDVAFRICPIEKVDAVEMLRELRGAALFRGARGREPASFDALVDALLKVGGKNGVLMGCADAVSEIDVNPIIVTRDAAIAVDARFILTPLA